MGRWLPYRMALERRLEATWAKRARSHRMSIEGGIDERDMRRIRRIFQAIDDLGEHR